MKATRTLALALCVAGVAACATLTPEEIADRKSRQQVTGSNIPKKVVPGQPSDVVTGSREDYQTQMDKGADLRPRARSVPGTGP